MRRPPERGVGVAASPSVENERFAASSDPGTETTESLSDDDPPYRHQELPGVDPLDTARDTSARASPIAIAASKRTLNSVNLVINGT
jgi:hypothetical protein